MQSSSQGITTVVTAGWRKVAAWLWLLPGGGGAGMLRTVLRVIMITAREFRRDNLTLWASAMTYTVIFSLVPLLALGTAVLKEVGAGDSLRAAAHHLIDQIEDPGFLAGSRDDSGEDGPPGQVRLEAPAMPRSLLDHLRKGVDTVFDYVDATNFTTLGAFGIFGLLMAAFLILGTIERAMNAIWRVRKNRSIPRRILGYFGLVVILPLAINLGLAAEAALRTPVLQGLITGNHTFPWLGAGVLKLMPIILVAITLSLLYRWLPNTRVNRLPALAGGFFAGISWFIVQGSYLKMQIGVARYNAIYGSFATLPLFLLWIYLGWVIFLIGAEVAFAVQFEKHYSWRFEGMSPLVRMGLSLEIMDVVLDDCRKEVVTTLESLVVRLKRPDGKLIMILDGLIAHDLVRRQDGRTGVYLPGASVGGLSPGELTGLICRLFSTE